MVRSNDNFAWDLRSKIQADCFMHTVQEIELHGFGRREAELILAYIRDVAKPHLGAINIKEV